MDNHNKALPLSLDSASVNHLISYGQSLSIGATGLPVISDEPYFNITFAAGPRAYDGSNFGWGPFKPLVEDANPAPDGGDNRGETPCYEAANYATALRAGDGYSPEEHVILASAAGRGNYRLEQLEKDTEWYTSVLIAHIQNAHQIEADHVVHAMMWLQGESDGVAETPYLTYKSKFKQLANDISIDTKRITGQKSPVYTLTYQSCTNSMEHRQIQQAQLDAAKESDNIYFVSPIYHIPHAHDNVHLTNVGYKWIGAYFGRAYRDMLENKKPAFLEPVSAIQQGNEIRVRFNVPVSPLVLDDVLLPATSDYGFAIEDELGLITIDRISVDGDYIIIFICSETTGKTTVRYAMDYIGRGLAISKGASGNLRDSDKSYITIENVKKPLFHVAPHFELEVTR